MEKTSRYGWALACALVVCLALVIRVLFVYASGGLLWPDSLHYYTAARPMAEFRWPNHVPVFQTPLYAFFLGIHFAALGLTPLAGWAVIISQHLLGFTAGVLTYFIGRRFLDKRPSLLAACLCSLHFLGLYYETTLLTEALFSFLLTLCVFLTVYTRDRCSIGRLVLLGACYASLTLTRSVALYYVLPAAAYLSFVQQGRRRKAIAPIVMCLIYAACILPLCINNYENRGFFGVTKGVGVNLFLRVFQKEKLPLEDMRPEAKQVFADFQKSLDEGEQRAYFRVYYALAKRLHSEAAADDFMLSMALPSLKKYALTYAWSCLSKMYQIFFDSRQSPDFCTDREDIAYLCVKKTVNLPLQAFPNRPPGNLWARQAVHFYGRWLSFNMAVMSLLAFLGFAMYWILKRENLPVAVFLFLSVIYYTLLPSLLNMPEDRYRLPIDHILFIFAAYFLFEAGAKAAGLIRRNRASARPAEE